MGFHVGATIIDYNIQWIANQMRDFKKGKAIYIYNSARKNEIDSEIKLNNLKAEITIVYNKESWTINKIDYWVYVRRFR